ncbi:hypothetical protein KW782_02700 [Candidatus Parcubacteria bacterium]|nr:hypothetical protein [Candidatus Parcubacteria bacterium]
MKNLSNQQHFHKMFNKEHEGKWVAISSDHKKIIGYSSNLQSLAKQVETDDVVYLKVPLSDVRYAFC